MNTILRACVLLIMLSSGLLAGCTSADGAGFQIPLPVSGSVLNYEGSDGSMLVVTFEQISRGGITDTDGLPVRAEARVVSTFRSSARPDVPIQITEHLDAKGAIIRQDADCRFFARPQSTQGDPSGDATCQTERARIFYGAKGLPGLLGAVSFGSLRLGLDEELDLSSQGTFTGSIHVSAVLLSATTTPQACAEYEIKADPLPVPQAFWAPPGPIGGTVQFCEGVPLPVRFTPRAGMPHSWSESRHVTFVLVRHSIAEGTPWTPTKAKTAVPVSCGPAPVESDQPLVGDESLIMEFTSREAWDFLQEQDAYRRWADGRGDPTVMDAEHSRGRGWQISEIQRSETTSWHFIVAADGEAVEAKIAHTYTSDISGANETQVTMEGFGAVEWQGPDPATFLNGSHSAASHAVELAQEFSQRELLGAHRGHVLPPEPIYGDAYDPAPGRFITKILTVPPDGQAIDRIQPEWISVDSRTGCVIDVQGADSTVAAWDP